VCQQGLDSQRSGSIPVNFGRWGSVNFGGGRADRFFGVYRVHDPGRPAFTNRTNSGNAGAWARLTRQNYSTNDAIRYQVRGSAMYLSWEVTSSGIACFQ
jgi:hypothetical protein